MLIEQAIYGSQDAGGYRFLARSPGFADEWLPEAERLCAGFGDRPAGVACPGCVFAQPFGKHHLAVVQAADQGTDDAGRPGALAFHLLIVPRAAYLDLSGDPFALAERFPAPWEARGALPALSLPRDPLPPRTVAEVRNVLQRPDGPTLLGGAQALVDGGRLLFERNAPDTDLLRALWSLLPASNRRELWPASFAFDNRLGFDILVMPRATAERPPGYVTEAQAADYPHGRYEYDLQMAAEAGDQEGLDALFARRSRAQTWRLGLILLAVMTVMALATRFLGPAPVVKERPPAPSSRTTGSTGAHTGRSQEVPHG